MAKISGQSMWFVYNVSIDGVNGNGKDLQVDFRESKESEVQTKMQGANISYEGQVSVRVKTHFENPRHLAAENVPAETNVSMFIFIKCVHGELVEMGTD